MRFTNLAKTVRKVSGRAGRDYSDICFQKGRYHSIRVCVIPESVNLASSIRNTLLFYYCIYICVSLLGFYAISLASFFALDQKNCYLYTVVPTANSNGFCHLKSLRNGQTPVETMAYRVVNVQFMHISTVNGNVEYRA